MFSYSSCDTGDMWIEVIVELKLLSVSLLGVSSPVNTQAQWAEHKAYFINFCGLYSADMEVILATSLAVKAIKLCMHKTILFFNIIEHILLHYVLLLQIYFKKNVLINFLQPSSKHNGQVVSRQWTGYRILRGLLLFKLKTWGHSADLVWSLLHQTIMLTVTLKNKFCGKDKPLQ